MDPCQFVDRMRVEAAQQMIDRSSMGLKEIADKCGSASVDSMRTTFLRLIGVTAGEYTSSPGSTGQFADVPLHAGLICINGPDGMTAEVQCELFRAALDEIGDAGQLVNEVIEVDLESLGADFTIQRYALPEEVN